MKVTTYRGDDSVKDGRRIEGPTVFVYFRKRAGALPLFTGLGLTNPNDIEAYSMAKVYFAQRVGDTENSPCSTDDRGGCKRESVFNPFWAARLERPDLSAASCSTEVDRESSTMVERSLPLVHRLRDESGQSWVETVVMLPVIVALLLGLFYLHDLVTTKIRAIQAARFVAWESTWYLREDNDNRKMTLDTQQKLKDRLRKVGLGGGLANIDVFKRQVRVFHSDVKQGGEPSTFFVPAPLNNLISDSFGGDQSGNFLDGIAGSLSGVLDGLLSLAGDGAFVFQDLMAKNTNWDNEIVGSVYTARLIYKFGYTGFFSNFGTSTIVQRASVLSHPYAVKRSNNGDELDDMLGSPCSFDSSDHGHVTKLWLFPQGGAPPISSGGTSADSVTGVIDSVLDIGGGAAKCAISGIVTAFGGLGNLLSGDTSMQMPAGTLKESPELSMPANSGDSSGGGLGKLARHLSGRWRRRHGIGKWLRQLPRELTTSERLPMNTQGDEVD